MRQHTRTSLSTPPSSIAVYLLLICKQQLIILSWEDRKPDSETTKETGLTQSEEFTQLKPAPIARFTPELKWIKWLIVVVSKNDTTHDSCVFLPRNIAQGFILVSYLYREINYNHINQ